MAENVRPRYVGHLRVSYNADGDVLYISIGEPRAALTVADDEGLLIRRDPETYDIVGITILDYEQRFRRLPDVAWLESKSLPEELLNFVQRRPAV